jgi:hypothetical protein
VNLNYLGKFLVLAGFAFIGPGVILLLSDKIPFPGELPGDIVVTKRNFTLYFPIATSILISIILSIVFYSLGHFRK